MMSGYVVHCTALQVAMYCVSRYSSDAGKQRHVEFITGDLILGKVGKRATKFSFTS